MLACERQRMICKKVQTDGRVLVSELAKEFNVSDETIRRDINYLNQKNFLRKVHGGALPILRNEFDPAYDLRAEINIEQKRKIGIHAIKFIEENDVIALGAGVTVDEMARLIDSVSKVTVLLNSVPALNYLMDKKLSGNFSGNIIFIGGIINAETRCTMGNFAIDFLKNFSIDKAFVGATAVSSDGIRMSDIDDGNLASVMISAAAEVFVLAESEKIGKRALYKACDLEDIHHIITDDTVPINHTMKQQFEDKGIQLHIV